MDSWYNPSRIKGSQCELQNLRKRMNQEYRRNIPHDRSTISTPVTPHQ